MGAYLSTPNREKESVDYNCEAFSYGASSMQGWRISQEDAHNCCPDFDVENSASLFAVYDGHGGAEVAQYTAQNFPDFLKKTKNYKEGAIGQALEDAFMAFDESLTKEDVIDTLKELAGVDDVEEDEEEQQNEVAGLFEEAEMPIEKLMERYGAGNKSFKKLREQGDDFQSPALRGKKDSIDKIEAEHIKQNMSNKLINGNHDDEEDQTKCVANGEDAKTLKENVKNSSSKNVDSTVDSITPKEEHAKSDSSHTEKCSDKKDTVSQDNNVTLPDSTQTDSKTETSSATETTDTPAKDSSSKSNSQDSCNSTNEVSSSSEGPKPAESEPEKGEKCTGSGSSSEAASTDAGGSSAGPAGGSEAQEGPMSSTGRRRSKRTGVIPAEGEDESSCDEDDETSDSDDEIDEEDITESDSEDDDMAGFEGMADDDEEGDDEEEEERDVVFGGEEPGSDSGCTAVVAVLKEKELYVANAGDSRCVVCRDGKAIDMSIDHKPEDELERKRIEKAGGQVTEDNRVNGGLNLSRAIGDHVYKKNADLPLKEQMITALPDVKSLTLTEEDEFMVLACDGIWNVMSSQDVCVFVRDRFKAGGTKISQIIEEMFEFCMAPDTTGDGTGCDNMTCIIVKLHQKSKDSSDQSAPAAVKRRASEDSESADSKKTKDGD